MYVTAKIEVIPPPRHQTIVKRMVIPTCHAVIKMRNSTPLLLHQSLQSQTSVMACTKLKHCMKNLLVNSQPSKRRKLETKLQVTESMLEKHTINCAENHVTRLGLDMRGQKQMIELRVELDRINGTLGKCLRGNTVTATVHNDTVVHKPCGKSVWSANVRACPTLQVYPRNLTNPTKDNIGSKITTVIGHRPMHHSKGSTSGPAKVTASEDKLHKSHNKRVTIIGSSVVRGVGQHLSLDADSCVYVNPVGKASGQQLNTGFQLSAIKTWKTLLSSTVAATMQAVVR